LNRIYGKFNKNLNIPNTSTNDSIRQFINILPSQGLAMVSYSDTKYADYWNNYNIQGEKELRSAVLTHLQAVFPEIPKIPKPKWLHSYYWKYGVHMWKTGIDSQKTKESIEQIFGKDIPIFIIGEAYSTNQAWIEGALETVDDVFPKIQNILKQKTHIKQHGGDDKWVKVKINNKLVKIDTSEWMNHHPGGASPFELYNHQTVNKYMKNHSQHFIDGDVTKGFKQEVINAINQYKHDSKS
jgi:hypothetical protein